jgi:hypothetical protein
MSELLWYNCQYLYKDPVLCDTMGDFLDVARLFHPHIGLVDRSGVITHPLRISTRYPLPQFDPKYPLDFQAAMQARMSQLDALHHSTGRPFRLMYSGGLDSTGILAAFVDYYGAAEAARLLEISCTTDGMYENPEAWNRIIRPNGFRLHNSMDHTDQWTDDAIIIMGELGSELFSFGSFAAKMAPRSVYESLTFESAKYCLSKYLAKVSDRAVQLTLDVCAKSPFEIHNLYLYYWYIQFVLAWDGTANRVLGQANQQQLPSDVLLSRLINFYNCKELELWSMRNHYDYPDRYGSPEEYKQIVKDYAINVLQTPGYATKFKFQSFPRVHSLRPIAAYITDDLRLHHDVGSLRGYIR